MDARKVDIVAGKMEDETCDQTGQNSAGQVSTSEGNIQTFCNSKFRNAFKFQRNLLDTLTLIFNCRAKLLNA